MRQVFDHTPGFCQSCGRPMRVVERRTGYDSATGEPRYESQARCTAGVLVQVFGLRKHDIFVRDSYGWVWWDP